MRLVNDTSCNDQMSGRIYIDIKCVLISVSSASLLRPVKLSILIIRSDEDVVCTGTRQMYYFQNSLSL